MTNMVERARAAKLVARLTRTHVGRHYLSHNGYKSGQAIVVAEYEEKIRDVMARVNSHNPPVTVALVKAGRDELFIFSIEPGSPIDIKGGSAAAPDSTIGMLYEAASQNEGGNETFKITEWQAATAHAVPSARQLLSF